MKRLFVREDYREHHAGSRLVEAIIESARADGFVETEPYYPNTMSDVIYMKKFL